MCPSAQRVSVQLKCGHCDRNQVPGVGRGPLWPAIAKAHPRITPRCNRQKDHPVQCPVVRSRPGRRRAHCRRARRALGAHAARTDGAASLCAADAAGGAPCGARRQPGGFAPRFETTYNWAPQLGPLGADRLRHRARHGARLLTTSRRKPCCERGAGLHAQRGACRQAGRGCAPTGANRGRRHAFAEGRRRLRSKHRRAWPEAGSESSAFGTESARDPHGRRW